MDAAKKLRLRRRVLEYLGPNKGSIVQESIAVQRVLIAFGCGAKFLADAMNSHCINERDAYDIATYLAELSDDGIRELSRLSSEPEDEQP
jgi:hypothetical protein